MAGFCIDCGRIIGFNAMYKGESARSVFELLCTRWVTAPDVVVYDNACNLAIYAHTCEAYLFRDTTFVVDRLH